VQLRVAEAISARGADALRTDALRTDGSGAALEPAVDTTDGPDEADAELIGLTAGEGDLCTLKCTVDREDAWLFEATRCLLDQLGERDMAAQSEALLAEAQGTLLALVPRSSRSQCAIDLESSQAVDTAQRRRVEQWHRWRSEAEVTCERHILGARALAPFPGTPQTASPAPSVGGPHAVAASLGIAPLEHATCVVLDRQVRSLCGALARHELELSRLVLRSHRAGGWRRLGYATEAQYARERLGLSRSSLAARRALALRLEKLPRVAAALGNRDIGVEAALQLVRIATAKTEAAWIERATQRTIKHLREEVAAARVAVRLAGDIDCPPPEDSEIAEFQTLEQAVVSGRFAPPLVPGAPENANSPENSRSPRGNDSPPSHDSPPSKDSPPNGSSPRTSGSAPPPGAARRLDEAGAEPSRPWFTMLGSLASWLARGLQMPAAAPREMASRACSVAGRVTLRLRMSRETYAWWRSLEAQARRWLPRGMSWLRFLCVSFWQAWRPLPGTQVAYGHIYVRDRFRCTSPVCNRRDVTPHHIQFRSAGGSDEDQNITSPCTWCHLQGVHGGRIRVSGTADQLRWEFGPRNAPSLVVQGRERMVA